GLRAPLVAEWQRLRDPAARPTRRRPADPGRPARPGGRPRRAGPQALRRAQPWSGCRAHGRRRARQGLRPATLAAPDAGARRAGAADLAACQRLGERRDDRFPGPRSRLAEETRGRVPGGVVAVLQPAPAAIET